MHKIHIKNRGFTLIETLVAITILLIAITGPLTIAEKGLTAAVSSQDRLTGSYLAQDLTEYVKNVRDDNLLSGQWWLNNLAVNVSNGSAICAQGTTNSPCDFDTLEGNPWAPSFVCSTPANNLCLIYDDLYGGINGFSYYSPYKGGGTGQQPTKFSRAFTITPIGGTMATAQEAQLTVTVSWKTGNIPENVVLQTIILNTTR